MRPRPASELLAPDRLARVLGTTNPSTMPRYFRQLVRENHIMQSIDFLVGVRDGTELFDTVVVKGIKGGGQMHEIIKLPAPVLGRIQAAFKLIDIGIPKTAAITDADGEPVTGVVALPDLELRHIQEHLHIGRMKAISRTNGVDGDEELVYVIEEETVESSMAKQQDADVPPPQIEETVSPELVAHILAKQQGKLSNGKKGR